MNTHIPQHVETTYELAELTAVPTQVIKPATSEPVIEVTNDTLIGAYLITQPHIKIPKKEVFNLLMTNHKFNGILPETSGDEWKGQDMFSMFLPDISFSKGNKSYDSNPDNKNNFVIIENGQFKQGILDKTVIGKTLIHMIYDSFGPNAVKDFLDNNQRMLNRWLTGHSFTVSLGDCTPTKEDNQKITEYISEKIKDVNTLIKQANTGVYKQNLDNKFIKISLENEIMGYLQSAVFAFQKYISKNINNESIIPNNIFSLINSGTKGSNDDLGQIRGFIGQATIMGHRIGNGFTRRSLTHFTKDDYGAKSRGFIANNFFNGLDPIELFFHQMNSREGSIDTAIKTAESGYMQRRWIKALEDLTVKYGGTVRNGINNIVQFSYGDDGIDPCKLNKQDLKLVEMSDNELEKKFLITEEDLNMLKTIMVPEAYKEMTSQKDYVNLLKKDFDILRDMRNYARNNYFPDMNVMNTTVYSPLLFSRAIKNARDTFKIQMNKKSDLTPDYIRKCFQELEDELEKYLPSYSLNIFRCLLRSNLAVKLSMLEYRFNKTVFKFVIDNIREKYLSSIVQPGEMVGIIAAQSMGEKLTQMSVPGDTRILINISGKLVKTSIGEFIDSTIRSKNGKIFVDNSGKHTIMEINEDTKILSVSNDEKISWRKISKISRHPANGQLMKVETRTGRTTRATLSHSFLKRTINGIEPVEGSKLKVGDRIPLTLSVNEIENALTKMKIGEKDIDLDEHFGYFSAIFSMEGSTNKFGIKINRKPATDFTEMNVDRVCLNNGWPAEFKETVINIKNLAIADFMQKNFEQLPADKSIPAFIYQTNLEYIKGFLAGLIDISGNIDDKKMSIRFSSYSQQYLRELCLLFNYIGVYGYLGMDKRRDNEIYTLSITRKYIPLVNDVLNLNCFYKNVSLTKIINYVNRDEVHDVSEYIDKIPEVGEIIAETGKLLKLKDHARIYGRWKNKESIGRRTLLKYIDAFKMENSDIPEIKQNIKLLEQAANSDVVWDEIISIEYYDGPDDEYVYDFTVPGTESFLVDDSIMVHNTLNTFHSVGVSAKAIITAKGIPRIREIINVAKTIKSPYMRIFLKDEFTSDVNKAKIISNQIEFTKLQDIVDKTMIIYENPNQETNSQEDMEFIQTYQEFASLVGVSQCPEDQLSRWVLRIVFNKEKMMNKNIYLSDIQDVIQLRNDVENDVQCTFSDDNAKELMLRIRVNLDTTDGDYLGFLQELEKVLMSITIRGIPGVEKVEPEMRMKIQYNSDGSYNQVSEWLLTTYGVNLLDVLMNENVDPNRTLSNDIHEINEIFGIEATRAIIIRELKMDDFDVNYRHLSLLGDIMTHRGVIMPIERHGINRSSERGPIAKATFEESTDILVKASTFAEKDKMGGVSANIMFGQLPKVGTNSFDLLFDESKFMAELKKVKENNLNKVIAESNGEEGLMKNIESKLANEYEENLGDIIDAQFGFSFDATKNSEKQLIPHLMPDTSLEIDDKKPKKKITMKKK